VTEGHEWNEEQSDEPSGGSTRDLTGRLLVASPRLADPSFDRTVVLVLDHSPAGALGLILNRPTAVPVEEILAQWHEQATKALPAVIFSGGPVSPGAVIGLVRGSPSGEPAGWHPVLGDIGAVDLSVAPDDQPSGLDGARLFSGYAGWSPDQLDQEVEEGAWFCLDALEDDLLTRQPTELWHDVLQRQGGELRLLATYPPHPSVN
jgi:putative transcriptional regulator